MSFQIYFVQNEEDTIQFLDQLETIKVALAVDGALRSPIEIKNEVINQMSSFAGKYTIVPESCSHSLRSICEEIPGDLAGIEYQICCKQNRLSRTYDVGRLYYKNCESSSYHAQMLALCSQLRAYIKNNYFYSKNSRVYFAPQFKQLYDSNYYFAMQLGRPITF